VLGIRLADFKAKPVANHANVHPITAWSCRICNQHCAHVTLRRTGFKPYTTRPNFARTGVAGLPATWPRIFRLGQDWHFRTKLRGRQNAAGIAPVVNQRPVQIALLQGTLICE
jgi:hypothetical protein